MKFLALTVLTYASFGADAFLAPSVQPLPSISTTIPQSQTVLFLEDWVADMIDSELVRQSHKKEYENQWMEKNRAAVMSRMETDFAPVADDASEFRQVQKDKLLAAKDPAKYCADRCVTTGHCDVYEDFFELSPEQVIEFCVDCVLSEEEEPCDIPEGFYDKLMP